MAISSFMNGQIKSSIKITMKTAVKITNLDAFRQACNMPKQSNIRSVKRNAIMGKLSAVPIIMDTEMNRAAISNRIIVFLVYRVQPVK